VLVLGLVISVYVVVSDGRRVLESALAGTLDWLFAVLAGTAAALVGVIMAVRAVRLRRAGVPPRRRGLWLGLSYTAVATVTFLLTHPRHGGNTITDSTLGVAALTAQVVLAIPVVALIVGALVSGFRSRGVESTDSD
jgi:hypothetical protein